MSPLERAAPARLAHVRGLARPVRPELAPGYPLSAKSDPGPPSPQRGTRCPQVSSVGVLYIRVFLSFRGPCEGAQDSCRIRAGEPGPEVGTEAPRWLQTGPETGGAYGRLCSPSSPFTQRAQVPVEHLVPHLLWKVSSSEEPPRRRAGKKFLGCLLMAPDFQEGGGAPTATRSGVPDAGSGHLPDLPAALGNTTPLSKLAQSHAAG